jgi:hypothetical protein
MDKIKVDKKAFRFGVQDADANVIALCKDEATADRIARALEHVEFEIKVIRRKISTKNKVLAKGILYITEQNKLCTEIVNLKNDFKQLTGKDYAN